MAGTDPPYARIVADIRRRIDDGELVAGDRVPSTRQLTREWGVAMATATKALSTLRQAGLVHARPGVGTVVAGARPAPPRAPRRVPRERDTTGESVRDRVVRAAVTVADAEGLSALSMRRVAAELGVATMSLYRHVPGKDELVLLIADAIFADHPLPAPDPPGWRAMFETIARLQWTMYRRHPWLAQALSLTRPQVTPNLVPHTEWALRALAGFDLDTTARLHVHLLMVNFVRGLALNLDWEAAAEQDTGLTIDQWMATQDAAWRSVVTPESFPLLAGIADEFDLELDELFEFGLGRLLDGLGVFLEPRRKVRNPPA